MTPILRAVLAFALISFLGWFCAWIGGVEPFTGSAGMIALLTILFALSAGLVVYLDFPGDKK